MVITKNRAIFHKKRPFLPDKINLPAPPAEIHGHPGLHLSRTRMSVPFTPGSRIAFQAVFGKRKAGLDGNRSRFNIFCIYS